MMVNVTVWAFLVSISHVALIRESNFGAETLLNTQNVTPEKVCLVEKLSSPSSKKMEALSSVKRQRITLWTIIMRLFWTSLSMARLSADCYGLGYFAKVLSIGMKMPDVIHQTGQLLHLISCGSLPILCLVVDLSLNPWEAPGWQVIAVDADVKQVVTSWLQALDIILFALEHKPWYHCGEMPRW
jgi:hypothetical protein